MAIGKTPLFSELSGSCGPVDFRTRMNGKIEIGTNRDPTKKPKTAAQQQINEMYGYAVEIWNTSSEINKNAWNEKGDLLQISGWNYLVYIAINPARSDEAEYNISRYGT